jgi:hypothetical protein
MSASRKQRNASAALLHELGDTILTEHVVADVGAELAAVEHAERGDLSGRAK